jgi:hypothetical protein
LLHEAETKKPCAYYTKSTHNVYLTPKDKSLDDTHVMNRQVISSKGCIATDQIPDDSILRKLYHDETFQKFLAMVFEVNHLFPYKDPLSSINIHYASEGQELGWHFDNSAFAITLMLQKPLDGGKFEYIPNLRTIDGNLDLEFQNIEKVLDGKLEPITLDIEPGMLLLFRGRTNLHRVTPVIGKTTRILVVFAYNENPDVELSEEARLTFFGRKGY